MTRANARELALHLIYGRGFTGEEPEQVVAIRLEKEYYAQLSSENEIYEERPSRAQLRYLDTIVVGIANREEELNGIIGKFSFGFKQFFNCICLAESQFFNQLMGRNNIRILICICSYYFKIHIQITKNFFSSGRF